jgi:hypothetical protein
MIVDGRKLFKLGQITPPCLKQLSCNIYTGGSQLPGDEYTGESQLLGDEYIREPGLPDGETPGSRLQIRIIPRAFT